MAFGPQRDAALLDVQQRLVGKLGHGPAGAVVEELDATTIRMAGYLLPLDYSGRRVTEFLLVPWVGACIHTPPPAPNQVVYVVYPEGFEAEGLFTHADPKPLVHVPVLSEGREALRRAARGLKMKRAELYRLLAELGEIR